MESDGQCFKWIISYLKWKIFSSEDEDFYDAEDDDDDAVNVFSSNVIENSGEDAEISSDLSTPVNEPLPEAFRVDYDAMYDADDGNDDDVDMKSHGSVIAHMLSQVQ